MSVLGRQRQADLWSSLVRQSSLLGKFQGNERSCLKVGNKVNGAGRITAKAVPNIHRHKKNLHCSPLTAPNEEPGDPVISRVTLGQASSVPNSQSKPQMDTKQHRNDMSQSLGARANALLSQPQIHCLEFQNL